jgi:hypothetical protein
MGRTETMRHALISVPFLGTLYVETGKSLVDTKGFPIYAYATGGEYAILSKWLRATYTPPWWRTQGQRNLTNEDTSQNGKP